MKKISASRVLWRAFLVAIAVLTLAALAFYFHLRASLPLLDGKATLSGLTAPVSIERDANGHPAISGENRADLARALGFLHAQERFFQMDLSRRQSAGELSALVGSAAVSLDRATRPHRFRSLAQTVISRLPPQHRALLDSYTAGVNSGLTQLSVRPFEYVLLRESPKAWLAEDSILVIYSMALNLQPASISGQYERSLATLRDILDPAALAYFAPLLTSDDSAYDGSSAPLAPMPTAKQVDLRRRETPGDLPPLASRSLLATSPSAIPGSNALITNRTNDKRALLAGDPHLALSIPNTWYRATLRIQPTATSTPALNATGLTLPGLPALVIGSNGYLAWTFTNACADTADLCQINPSIHDKAFYMHDGKSVPIQSQIDHIEVKGERSIIVETQTTHYGPIVGIGEDSRPLALRWTLQDPTTINLDLLDLENAHTISDALPIAHRAGVPPQNIFLADTSGAIAWTIAGKLPHRINHNGRLPSTWYYGDRGWSGYLPPSEIPTRIITSGGHLWNGNQRPLSSPALNALGDGAYETPYRAARLRDLLTNLPPIATPRDLLNIQLDATAPQLTPWRDFLLKHLSSPSLPTKKIYTDLRTALSPWNAQAQPDSTPYALVRRYRDHMAHRILGTTFATCYLYQEDFSYSQFHYQPALWQLIHERPPHFLDPAYATWDDLLNTALEDLIRELDDRNLTPATATWSHYNTTSIRHPINRLLPRALTHWLDAPATALPGDTHTPRVQRPAFGASARFIVSPGHESEGILQTPCGQSGHPLSPYYMSYHPDWETGAPTPLLPSKTCYQLTLTPN